MGRKKPIIDHVEIVSFGHKGLTIGKTVKGEAVLVEGAVPGDVVRFQARRKKKGMKLGHVVDFTTLSPHRKEAVCQHFEHCGGCSWQNMAYDAQLKQKANIVESAMRRIGNLTCPINPIIGGHPQYYYRNKIEYTFANKRWLTKEEIESGQTFDEGGLGFHRAGMYDKVVDIEACHLQAEPTNAIRNRVRSWAQKSGWSYYDYKHHRGDLRNLIVRLTRAGNVMVTLVTAVQNEELAQSFVELMDDFDSVSSVVWMVNQKLNDSLSDVPFKVLKGPGYIVETLDGVSYKIGPKSFFQTNPYQAEVLFREVRKAAALKPTDTLYDLYCGVGSIGLYLAQDCENIVGIEEVPEAINDARENARLNNMPHPKFEVGDVGALLDPDFIAKYGAPDVVVTDPPRAGMHESVVETINLARVRRLVYVSCNPSTQARDLARLSAVYDVESVTPVDMFPQTNHVESIATLNLRS